MSNKSDTSVFEGEEETKQQLSNKIMNMQSSPKVKFNYQTQQQEEDRNNNQTNRQKSKTQYQLVQPIHNFTQSLLDNQHQSPDDLDNYKESNSKIKLNNSGSDSFNDIKRVNQINSSRNENIQQKKLSSPIKNYKFHGMMPNQSIYNAQALADQDEILNISFSENIDESPSKSLRQNEIMGMLEGSQEFKNKSDEGLSGLNGYQARDSVLIVGMGLNSNNQPLENRQNSPNKDIIILKKHSSLSYQQSKQLQNSNQVLSENSGLSSSPMVFNEPDSIEFIEEEHLKIYEFRFNENNAKSVISSTDRKYPHPQTQVATNQSQNSLLQEKETIKPFENHASPNQFMTYNQKHFTKQLQKNDKNTLQQNSPQNTLKQYASSFNSPGTKLPNNKVSQIASRNNNNNLQMQGNNIQVNSKSNSTFDVSKLVGFNSIFKNSSKEQKEDKNNSQIPEDIQDLEDGSFEFEIKNLDTNEVFKMHVPVTQSNDATSQKISQQNTIVQQNNNNVPTTKIDLNYASKRRVQGGQVILVNHQKLSQDNEVLDSQSAAKPQAIEKVEQQLENTQDQNKDFPLLLDDQQIQHVKKSINNFDGNEDMRNGQMDNQLIISQQEEQFQQQHQSVQNVQDEDKTSLVTQRNVKGRQFDDQKVNRQNTQKLLMLKKISLAQPMDNNAIIVQQQPNFDNKELKQIFSSLIQLKQFYRVQSNQVCMNTIIQSQQLHNESVINTNDSTNIIPNATLEVPTLQSNQIVIDEDRKLKLIKEIYCNNGIISQPKNDNKFVFNPYGECFDCLPSSCDEDYNQVTDQDIAINFDQLQEKYENLNEYSKIKHHYLSNYIQIQAQQIRQQQKKQRESNDIIICIRNSVLKHLGMGNAKLSLEQQLYTFDVEKTRQNYIKGAMQLMPQNTKDHLQAKLDLQKQNSQNLLTKSSNQSTQNMSSTFVQNQNQKIGFIDFLGIYHIELQDHHVFVDERNFFSKMMLGDRQKQEKEAKIESFKIIREIIEIEMRKFELWNLYTKQVNQILNFNQYQQEEAQIREYIFREGLFGVFNPLLNE